jgi:8-oxo-dGTP pyrophosphatase MutT (NUDIX family)
MSRRRLPGDPDPRRMDPLLERLETALSGRVPGVAAEWTARPAAVLVPLLEVDGQWRLLFTQRTDHVETHRGQVSFPGGRIEAIDADAVAAALREAQEEIGLRPDDVRVLGRMDSLMTVTQYVITPVEVAEVFTIPVAWLADGANLERRTRPPLAGGPDVPVYSYREYEGHVLWGASARITLDLLTLLGLRGA